MWRNPPAPTSSSPTVRSTSSQSRSVWWSPATTPWSSAGLTTGRAATPPACSRTIARTYRHAATRRTSRSPMGQSIHVVRQPIAQRFPRPSVMGVVNVTPDSFSDGGVNLEPRAAVASAQRLRAEGAALVDVGGESTRPGSAGVDADEELRRVVPVLEALSGEVPLSIDTSKAPVARAALDLGAELVNDVTALRGDPALAGVVADADCYLCLMHMQGEPRTMQADPTYADVSSEVASFLEERLRFAVEAGIDEERICLDPGIG